MFWSHWYHYHQKQNIILGHITHQLSFLEKNMKAIFLVLKIFHHKWKKPPGIASDFKLSYFRNKIHNVEAFKHRGLFSCILE